MSEKFLPYKSIGVAIILFIIVSAAYYFFDLDLSLDYASIIAFLVGLFAIYLYIKQREDAKRDAARIIIQEIRRAKEIISDYKQSGGYQFAKKIIATNSWNKNIHFFVGNLDNDELDKISNLYSTGEYLDSLIQEISHITLNDEVEKDKKFLEIQLKHQNQKGTLLEGSTYPIAQISEHIEVNIPGIRPVWKGRLDIISLKIEPIYNSTIVLKLKKIAKTI